MASKSKAKGNRIEREVVNIFKEYGYECQRAYGSDGRAMGEHEEVHVKAIIKNLDGITSALISYSSKNCSSYKSDMYRYPFGKANECFG